jgi:mercuric ion transport protein
VQREAGTGLLGVGAVASAVAASLCCLGPLVLAVTGLAGGAMFHLFAPYRAVFAALTILFLGGAFYWTYRRPSPGACETDGACTRPTVRRGTKIALWVSATLVLLLAAFNVVIQWF